MRLISKISTVFLVTAVLVGFSGCTPKGKPMTETRPLLGTEVTITIYDEDQTPESLKPAFDEAFRIMRELETKILIPGPENELDKVAAGAGNQSISLSPRVFNLVMDALKLYEETEKVFDIRVKPMLDAYGFRAKPRVPTDIELDSLKQLVLEGGMFVAGKSILLSKKGMGFTLYKIGPGYILDQAAIALIGKGIRNVMIQTDRLARSTGKPPDSRGFKVTIVNPLEPDKPLGTLPLPKGGYAMVACDEGAFEKDGKKYHKLLDPRSGKPADLCIASAIYAEDAAQAQALALSTFILGPTDGLKLLENFPNASGLIFFELDGQTMRKGTGHFKNLSTQ